MNLDSNKISRFMALFLALLIGTTSVGLTIDMHFCQDKLKSVNLFGQAKSCHEITRIAKENNCHSYQKMAKHRVDCSLEKKDCCHNKTVSLQLDQDQRLDIITIGISSPLQQFVMTYIAVFKTIVPDNKHRVSSFAYYKPPLLSKDIPILVQSFLL